MYDLDQVDCTRILVSFASIHVLLSSFCNDLGLLIAPNIRTTKNLAISQQQTLSTLTAHRLRDERLIPLSGVFPWRLASSVRKAMLNK